VLFHRQESPVTHTANRLEQALDGGAGPGKRLDWQPREKWGP
jgi:hypothetical protein